MEYTFDTELNLLVPLFDEEDEEEEEIRKQIWKEWYEDSNIENI